MNRLALNSSVLLSPLADGYVAYDTDTNCLHELNPTAALLVELCDGTRTVAEVIDVAAPMLPSDSAAAVRAWLEQATELTLLVERAADQPHEVRELSADELGYEGPEHLTVAISDAIGDRRKLSILDLGCGTGLAGERVKDRAANLVGIDLSAEMIERADERKIYDRLEVAEVTNWLNQATESFDLIVACDTFIYFGDLNQVIGPASRLLNPGGVIAFSVESATEPPFRLTDSGRYVHHREHIEDVARSMGLQLNCHEAFLRMEYGNEVTALYSTMTPV